MIQRFLLKVVGGEPDEWRRIAALLTMGFFTGIFLATYDVASTALFLEVFKDTKEVMLAWAMVGAGLLGVTVAVALSRLQRRMRYQKLVSAFFLMLTALICFIAFSLQISSTPVVVFIAQVAIGPVNAAVILLFWGIFGRIFPFRAAKRLAGSIDTGQAIATILGLFTIPFIEPLVGNSSQFLIGSAVCIVGCTSAAIYMARNFEFISLEQLKVQRQAEQQANQDERSLLKNKYASIMAVFVVCSSLAASFADYTFLTTVSDKFTDQGDLTQFLSFFGGMIVVSSFLVQTFLNDLILEMFGLMRSLLLLPILLLILTVTAIFVGHAFGYTAAVAGDAFLIFFVVTCLSKLFVDALRDSLESPTVKLFFFPLPINVRFDIQTKIEGFVSQSAGLIAGLLITALENFKFFDLIDCQYTTVGIIGLWGYATVRMHQGYSTALTKTLADTRRDTKNKGENDRVIPKLLKRELLQGENFELVERIAVKINPLLVEQMLCEFDRLSTTAAQAYCLHRIRERLVFEAMPAVERYLSAGGTQPNRALAEEVYNYLADAQKLSLNIGTLQGFTASANPDDRILASQLVAQHLNDDTFKFIIPLIRDLNPDVRRAAFLTVGKLQLEPFLPILIEHLSAVGYENTAVSAILRFGDKAFAALETAFYKTGQRQNVLINIVQIYGLIGSPKAIELLLKKTGFPDKLVVREVLYSLNYSNWTASGAMTAFIKNHLEQAVYNTLWALAVLEEISAKDYNRYLRRALREQLEHHYEEIFLLLSIIYDKQSVQLVMENIKNGTPDSIGYAIELLSVFVDDELLPLLTPILDDSSTAEKLKRLEGFFSRDSYSSTEALRQIMNRDFNSMNRWTRVCAIHSYSIHKNTVVTNDLVAHIFNPDELVQETAAWGVCMQDRGLYDSYMDRLPIQQKKQLNRVVLPAVAKGDDGTLLSMEKVVFLYRVKLLNGVSGLVLSDIIEWMEEAYFPAGKEVDLADEYGHGLLLMIESGQIDSLDELGRIIASFGPNDVVGHELVPQPSAVQRLVAQSDTRVYAVLSERFYEIMGDNYELTEKIIYNLESALQQQPAATNLQSNEA